MWECALGRGKWLIRRVGSGFSDLFTTSRAMPMADTKLHNLIEMAATGEAAARAALLDHACERLAKLTRKMLNGYPSLRRWEQTDDVLQNAMLRLHRAMENVEVESV